MSSPTASLQAAVATGRGSAEFGTFLAGNAIHGVPATVQALRKLGYPLRAQP